jgi:hypothetical protein
MERFCWICGAKTDSREHRLKKADLIRANGPGPCRGDSALIHYRDGKETIIQGPDSKHLKYASSLCQDCNNDKTQPFDRAYDTFINWIMLNEAVVLRRRLIDFVDVFGNEYEPAQRNLYKYFAKSFGCRIVERGAFVPSDVVRLLQKSTFLTKLRLTLAVNEAVLSLPAEDRKFIGNGDMEARSLRGNPSLSQFYRGSEFVSWLNVFYWYDWEPDGTIGSTWVADKRFIYLGSFGDMI